MIERLRLATYRNRSRGLGLRVGIASLLLLDVRLIRLKIVHDNERGKENAGHRTVSAKHV